MKEKLILRAIIIVLLPMIIISSAISQTNDWRSYFTGNNINVLAEQGDNIWLGTNGGGLFYYSKTTKQMVGNIPKSVNGLPDMFINAIKIVGDSMFIGTNNGFTIFDKSKFATFKKSNSSLPNNKVNAVDVDVFGGRWIGTDSGLAVLQGKKWTVYTTSNSGLPSNKITFIKVENTGAKWIGTDNGLVKFNGATWENFNTGNSGLPGDYINFIGMDNSGSKWVGTTNGLSLLIGATWISFTTSNSSIPGDNVTSLAFDKDHYLWISTNLGIARMNGSKFDVTDQSVAPLSSNFIKYLLIDSNDSKWLATSDSLNIQYSTYWAKRNVNITSLKTNIVNSAYITNGGNAWISTANGASVFNGTSWNFRNGTSGFNIRQTVIDKNNIVWLATDKGIIKISGFTTTIYDVSTGSLPSNDVRSIALDGIGNLWVGTASGLVKYNGSLWLPFDPPNALIPEKDINVVIVEGIARVWVGTQNGLNLFDGLSSWIYYKAGNSELPNEQITSLAVDNNGVLWIGTHNGLARFDEIKWHTFTTDNSDIAENVISSLSIDSTGKIWIGTPDNGISILNTNNTFSTLHIDNSALPDNHINGLSTDIANNVWISTNWGLLVYQNPSVNPSTYITGYPLNICAGKNTPITLQTLFTFANDNRFIVELSDTMGNFPSNPLEIGSTAGSGNLATITAFLPKNLNYSNTYRIRIKSTNPVFISNPSDFFTINKLPAPTITGRAAVCFNAITSYTAPLDATMNYDWQLTNGSFYLDSVGNSVTVNWSNLQANGKVRLILTNMNGCKDTTDYSVKISNHPSTSITGKLGVCANNEYMYQAKADPSIKYSWIATGGTVFSLPNHNSAWIKWGSPGVGKLQIFALTVDGCLDSSTVQINILPAPTAKISGPIYGEENIISTFNTPLTPPNVLKKWYAINGTIVGSDTAYSVQVNWKNFGFGYVIQVQTSSSGCIDSNTYMVRVFQNIDAQGFRDVCEDHTEYYSAASNLGSTNLWTVTGGTIQGAANQRVIPVSWGKAGKGTVRLIQSISSTPYKDTVDFDVIIHSQPVKPVITEKKDTLYSSIPIGNQWFWEDQVIKGATDSKYYTSQIFGTYTVLVTTAPGCISPFSDGYDFASSVNESLMISNPIANIYPNPSNGIFNLSFNESANIPVSYKVIDNLGRILISSSNKSNLEKNVSIDLSNNQSGSYILILNCGIKTYTEKLILNK